VPFALALSQLFLLLLAVAWLGVAGFAIPVAMIERDAASEGWFERLTYALYRSVQLARAEYLHAVGVAAALVLITLVFGIVLAVALAGFADNSSFAAGVLTQVILAPFLLLGLTVLYFEQRARALSSPRQKTRGGADAEVPDAVDSERAGPADPASEPGPRARGQQGR
jgi:hypothetical protein